MIPTGKAGLQPRIDAFNAALPGVVSDLRAQGRHVLLVDTDNVKVSEGLQDDAHPDDSGYARLGYDFCTGIMKASDLGWIQEPHSPPSVSDCQLPDVTALGDGWRALGVIAPGMAQTATYDRTEFADIDGDGRDDFIVMGDSGPDATEITV